jgi:hypothetical protein
MTDIEMHTPHPPLAPAGTAASELFWNPWPAKHRIHRERVAIARADAVAASEVEKDRIPARCEYLSDNRVVISHPLGLQHENAVLCILRHTKKKFSILLETPTP